MSSNKNLSQNEKKFLSDGYIISQVKNKESLDYISNQFTKFAKNVFEIQSNNSNEFFFNQIHKNINTEKLNQYRLEIINKVNSEPGIKEKLYEISKHIIDELVSNEVAVQRRLNLSIQCPNDTSSLLPIHADTWSGDSPFEIVVWLPLVDCYKTKSMYLLPPKYAKDLNKNFKDFNEKNAQDLFDSISDKVEWIDIKRGEVLLFNQSLPHGNTVNNENETRWSINCRFKGLFTPYGDKKLGEFFEPLNTKIMSKIGMSYKYPEII